jgi:hypothetical protein
MTEAFRRSPASDGRPGAWRAGTPASRSLFRVRPRSDGEVRCLAGSRTDRDLGRCLPVACRPTAPCAAPLPGRPQNASTVGIGKATKPPLNLRPEFRASTFAADLAERFDVWGPNGGCGWIAPPPCSNDQAVTGSKVAGALATPRVGTSWFRWTLSSSISQSPRRSSSAWRLTLISSRAIAFPRQKWMPCPNTQ